MYFTNLFITVFVIVCMKMSTVRSDFGSDLQALIKKQNNDIMKRNEEILRKSLADAFSGDGASALSTDAGNFVTTTQNGKKTTVGSNGPVAGAFGNAVATASDGSGTVVAVGH